MTEQPSRARTVFPWKILRSISAILLGLVSEILLSFVTAQLLRTLSESPQVDLARVAFAYRSVYVVLGGFLAAKFAPSRPMSHALALGGVWFLVTAAGVLFSAPMQFFGPRWYYFGLLITALPCALLGGLLHRRFHQRAVSDAA